MSFPAVKRAKGNNQCKQILDHGYRAGKNLPRASKHGHGKDRGTIRSRWRTYHEFSKRKNLMGVAREYFHELTDKTGRRMIPRGEIRGRT